MFIQENFLRFGFTKKNAAVLLFLATLPNFFSWFVFPTPFGTNFHFFQITIFLAAALFGGFGGAVAGALGSVGVGLLLGNPYLSVGNAILGGVAGFLCKEKRIRLLFAALIAFAIQLPWLYYSDVFLMHLPVDAVAVIAASLLLSNAAMAFAAQKVLPFVERRFFA